MKNIIIIFIFISTLSKAQEIKAPLNQNIVAGINYFPQSYVLSVHQVMPYISYNAGTEFFQARLAIK